MKSASTTMIFLWVGACIGRKVLGSKVSPGATLNEARSCTCVDHSKF